MAAMKPSMKTALKISNAFLLLGIAALAIHLSTGKTRGREQFPEGASHEFIRGDANDDGKVDVSDSIYSLMYLFGGGDAPPCLAAADSNDDAQVDISDPIFTLGFLFHGTAAPPAPYPGAGEDPKLGLGCRESPFPPLPAVGSGGGPDRQLTAPESNTWLRGRQIFDRPANVTRGLGPRFNGDSCRACHLDPVLGGAGGLDVDVVRFAHADDAGVITQIDGGPAVSRQSILHVPREEVPAAGNVVETRQTPTLFGLGLVDRIPEAAILANEDPNDADGDGISGRARRVNGGVGRFGHKAGVPSLNDFAADALFNELGLTVNPALSTFAVASDTDGAADPEMPDEEFHDLAFFLAHIAPPSRVLPSDATLLARVQQGEQLFSSAGCGRCHLPELAGSDGPVRAYSDFLLHDVASPARRNVNEPGVDPREFRTTPLWGVRDTAPYLHDGSAETLIAAIREHYGEALAARQAFEALSPDDQAKLVEFLRSL